MTEAEEEIGHLRDKLGQVDQMLTHHLMVLFEDTTDPITKAYLKAFDKKVKRLGLRGWPAPSREKTSLPKKEKAP